MMLFVLVAYLSLVFVLVAILHRIERHLAIPGFGDDAGRLPRPADARAGESGARSHGGGARAVIVRAIPFLAVATLAATVALAQPPAAKASAAEVLMRWAPLLLWGFAFNLLISIAAMAVGTLFGVPVGIAQLSRRAPVSLGARVLTQLFRNSPWLVL